MGIAIRRQPRPLPRSQPFSDMQRRVAEYILMPRDPNALRISGEAINDALRQVNTRFWHWSVRSHKYNSVANKRDYEIPTDFKAVVSGRWLDIDGQEIVPHVVYVDPHNFDQEYLEVNPVPNDPAAFTVRNPFEYAEPLRFSHPLDPGIISKQPFFQLSYYANLPLLDTPGDTFNAPPEIEGFIVMQARADVAAALAREKAPYAQNRATLLWAQMAKSDNLKNHRAIHVKGVHMRGVRR